MTTTMQRLVTTCEWKAAGDGSGALEGYASTFGNVDLQGDVVVKGAFAAALAKRDQWPLLADHRAEVGSVLGSVVAAREDERGLRIRAEFSASANAQEIRRKLAEGHLGELSIGYIPKVWEFADRNGERVRLLKTVDLYEVSLVTFAANPQARVAGVKTRGNAHSVDARALRRAGVTWSRDLARDVAELRGQLPRRKEPPTVWVTPR